MKYRSAGPIPTSAERSIIWVVDNSPLESEVVRGALSPLYDVAVFGTGETMLEQLATGAQPGVLVLDWHLPGLSGFDVCRFLRSNPVTLSLPVLLLTMYGTKADVVEGFAAGADDYLCKPFEPKELLARVALLLRGRQLRRRAERAQHALRRLFAHLPHGIIALDSRGAVTFANAETERILDLGQDSLVNVSLAELLPDVASYARIAAGDDVPLPDTVIRGRVFAPVLRPLPSDDATGTVLVLREVTQERRTDAALRESEERFRSLVEAIPQLVWTAYVDGEIDYANQRWSEYTGLSVAQTRGGGFSDAIHPDDRVATLECWADAVAKGEPLEVQHRFRSAAGTYRWFLVRALPMRNAQGSITRWFGTCTDIDDQKRAQRALTLLARAGAALASSLDQATSLRLLVDLVVPEWADWCGVYVRTDQDAIDLIACAHIDPAKVDLLRAIHKLSGQLPGSSSCYDEVVRTGEPRLRAVISEAARESEARDAAHLALLAELRSRSEITVPLRLKDRILGVVTFGTSESGRHFGPADLALAEEIARRAATALDNAALYELARRERARAEEANRAKDEFLAAVSHELRTPLNAILGWTRMLRSGDLAAEKRVRALETVERNARAQAQLVEDLLDISRIITGKLRINVAPVDLATVIESALDAVRPAVVAKNISIRRVVPEPGACLVMGDQNRLQQVVWNLLSNAIKFTPSGGLVQISLEHVDATAEVTVTDSGEGIHPEFLPYVFDRFRQADASISCVHGGLGLGLSIVRHLVEIHGGTIEAQSEGQGRGATFVARLPLSPQHEAAAGLEPSPVSSAVFECPNEIAGLRILVVDDQADARELLVSLLERCKAKVAAVDSAAAALEALCRDLPDVLVSDIGLPGEDGYSLIRKVRALPSDRGGRTPAVALTAYARTEDCTRALVSGFQTHVPKPIEPSELLVVIANLAGRISYR